MSFLSKEGLEYFWDKLKDKFVGENGGEISGGNLYINGNKQIIIEYTGVKGVYRPLDIKKTNGERTFSFAVGNGSIAYLQNSYYALRFENGSSDNGAFSFWNAPSPGTTTASYQSGLGAICIGEASKDYQATTLGQVKSLIAESGVDVEAITDEQIDAILAT